MSIKFVILGYLSWKPQTGYDLKKVIADSEVLPWTANNNQIYRALVQLHEDQWVTKTIEDQVGAPDRHVYTITEKGQDALVDWIQEDPGLPHAKKPFFHQLMWADYLPGVVIDRMLEIYQEMVADKLFLIRVQADRKTNAPIRSEREKFIWDRIYKNWIDQYQIEVAWTRQLRKDLKELEGDRLRM
jgi:DNA-binding PadR family transcriptional regulator